MKKFIVIFSLLVSMRAFSQEMPVIKISGNDQTKEYRVLFSSMDEQTVEISLLDMAGNEITSTTKNAKGFVERFDLTQVPAGTYKWKIVFGRRTLLEEFDLAGRKTSAYSSRD